MKNYLIIDDLDNVAIALTDLKKGNIIHDIRLKDNIPSGHKFSVKDISENANVIKYGNPIGHALSFIEKGSFVHSHNLFSNLNSIVDYSYNKVAIKKNKDLTSYNITGYHRKNKKVGIRNELWIVTSVGCINSIANILCNKFKESHKVISSFDGIYTITHPFGCSQLGEDLENTRTLLQRIVCHPNAGGVVVLGLGCENNNLSTFKETLFDYDESRIKFLNLQDEENEIEKGLALLEKLYKNMIKDKIEICNFSDITIGIKCGGSDGFSGITANPLIGKISDKLVTLGSSVIMGEVPEMFGAEHILMNRAKDELVYNKIISTINNFKSYFLRYNMKVYENPSPGNKKGGITTLEEKSLGCIQKSGKMEIVDVLNYGEEKNKNGVNLLSCPGNDLVATTSLGASGAQLILFTTGLGTPFGSFIPTMKISSNTNLYNKKKSWIDFNAGELLNDDLLINLEDDLFNLICSTINGTKVKNELYSDREIAIFKTGVTL